MGILELNIRHTQVLLKKAYEWNAKANKRHNRVESFKTKHAIKRLKNYKKQYKLNRALLFIPNKTEILLIMDWYIRCPPKNKEEKLVFMIISLVYKLHKNKLLNLKK